MKHKVLVGAVISTLLAFLLYSSNMKRVENAKLKVVGPTVSKVNKKSKKKAKEPKVKTLKEPKVNSIEYTNHVKAKSGSNHSNGTKAIGTIHRSRNFTTFAHFREN